MPNDRFYLDSPLSIGQSVVVSGDEAHHLTRVMRARTGDVVELVNGHGVLAEATVGQIERHACYLDVTHSQVEPPHPFQVILAQAIPRLNRLDTIVEKGTELGMNALWLFPGQSSERQELSDQQQKRLKAIAIAAMKQCGRLYLPEIILKPRLNEWEKLGFPAFYGAVEEEVPLFSTAWAQKTPKRGVFFFVGPEAGFSQAELACLKELGATGVGLHRHTLRTDTAPLVALSLIHQWV